MLKTKGTVVPVRVMKAHRVSRGTAPVIHNLSAREKKVDHFRALMLYPQRETLVPMELNNHSGQGSVKHLLPLPEVELQTVHPLLITIRVSCPGCNFCIGRILWNMA